MEAVSKMWHSHRRWITVAIILILLLAPLSRLTTRPAAAMTREEADADALEMAANCIDAGGHPYFSFSASQISLVCVFPDGNDLVCTWFYPFYPRVCTTIGLIRPPSVPVGGTVVVTGPTPTPTPRSAVVLPGRTGQLSQGPVIAASPQPAATPVIGSQPSGAGNSIHSGSGAQNTGKAPGTALSGPATPPVGVATPVPAR